MVTTTWTLWHPALVIALVVNLITGAAYADDGEQLTTANKPHIIFPKSSLSPDELGIIANRQDPDSIEIANYYAAKRNIPKKNILKVSFNPDLSSLTRAGFTEIYDHLTDRLPDSIQALVLTWTNTYRVDCMSITSAFALGFSEDHCAKGCKPTKRSPYFNSDSVQPFTDLRLRPTMMLAGKSVGQVKALIDRGVESDATHPEGTAYLVKTSDTARNTRAYVYDKVDNILGHAVNVELINADYIENKQDVLFYFTGLTNVPHITTNHYLPGAIADHLTSTGGVLSGSSQMSILRWIEAGATASYGAVVEPCNFPQKFPNPGVVASHYIQGESLIEAYWKSVEMPGQGLFVGEPLAKPYGSYQLIKQKQLLIIKSFTLKPGEYYLQSAKYGVGPYKTYRKLNKNKFGLHNIRIENIGSDFYRIKKASM